MHHFLWLAEDIMLFSITMDKHNLLCVLSLDKIHSKKNSILPIRYVVFSFVMNYIIKYTHKIASNEKIHELKFFPIGNFMP